MSGTTVMHGRRGWAVRDLPGKGRRIILDASLFSDRPASVPIPAAQSAGALLVAGEAASPDLVAAHALSGSLLILDKYRLVDLPTDSLIYAFANRLAQNAMTDLDHIVARRWPARRALHAATRPAALYALRHHLAGHLRLPLEIATIVRAEDPARIEAPSAARQQLEVVMALAPRLPAILELVRQEDLTGGGEAYSAAAGDDGTEGPSPREVPSWPVQCTLTLTNDTRARPYLADISRSALARLAIDVGVEAVAPVTLDNRHPHRRRWARRLSALLADPPRPASPAALAAVDPDPAIARLVMPELRRFRVHIWPRFLALAERYERLLRAARPAQLVLPRALKAESYVVGLVARSLGIPILDIRSTLVSGSLRYEHGPGTMVAVVDRGQAALHTGSFGFDPRRIVVAEDAGTATTLSRHPPRAPVHAVVAMQPLARDGLALLRHLARVDIPQGALDIGIRFHPEDGAATRHAAAAIIATASFAIAVEQSDLQATLASADLLITHTSNVAIDATLLGLPVILVAADEDLRRSWPDGVYPGLRVDGGAIGPLVARLARDPAELQRVRAAADPYRQARAAP